MADIEMGEAETELQYSDSSTGQIGDTSEATASDVEIDEAAGNKHQKLRQTLVSTEDQSTEDPAKLSLNSHLPTNTYKSAQRMADAFGLGSNVAFTSWIKGPAFQPYYQELKQHVRPQVETFEKKRMPARRCPSIRAVQRAIISDETYGERRYSKREGLDVDEFYDLDWYARCLVRLTEFNQLDRYGVFFGKKMSLSDMQHRLWHAMLRASSGEAPSRQSRGKGKTQHSEGAGEGSASKA